MFSSEEEYPETIKMPGGLVSDKPATWRSAVYRRAEEGVDGYAPCRFYDFAEWTSEKLRNANK